MGMMATGAANTKHLISENGGTEVMDSQSPQRTQRKARKLDRAKVLELSEQGLSTTDIAKHQGVAPSTVFRFLQQTEPERLALEAFKKERGDVFARLSAKSLDLQEKIVDTFDDALLTALTPSQKSGLLMTLNAQHGTLYDKERLERNLSTANVGVLGKIILQSEEELGKPNGKSVTPDGRTPQLGVDQPAINPAEGHDADHASS
jgi:transposase